MAEKWKIEGDYFESCNCDTVCACLIQNPPPRGRCDAALAFHVNQGSYGQTGLGGLNAVLVVSFPGPGKMGDGNWTAALYVDDKASTDQQEGLSNIFSGQAGGPMQLVSGLISNFLGIKTAPIAFTVDANNRRLTIPDVLEIDIEALTGRDGSEPLWVTNANHPVSPKLSLAKSNAYRYTDHNLAWDVSNTNGHFAPFSWQN
ncbi:MAG: DUF1326 domain-containing protein [Desulfurellaceae bacterium]|nr:DUF1326 domain-containing protein [Desulfurellaceae bacterium]